MSKAKLEQAIHSTLNKGEKAFVPYIMAGDGGLEKLEDQILFLQEAGATAIELGIPFSDPVADGPTIQEAGKRALSADTSLSGVLKCLFTFKERLDVPIILMTYINPIFIFGVEEFAKECRNSGVSGVIVPDVPVEEMDILADALKKSEIALIQLATLTSTLERIKKIASLSEGFLYAVTVKGITGTRNGFGNEVGDYLERIKKVSPVPVLAGFGISSPEQVKAMAGYCDGVIVGSKIIELIQNKDEKAIQNLVTAVK
ncbi:tryptophan synthase subunit alpha [Falsibacillus pallidus]|uniref:Tryptophan synthase alpha chain n=1 Tax=Falsibacillus pallidus TaxID=493781 RepID=A0A370GMM3_9BACI|nr:tryptophan synthase subunit alpha [Falsibacillus pallidus]RDI43153.1 tryptophan synthase alpha chain [Falsibacillus pallidus]